MKMAVPAVLALALAAASCDRGGGLADVPRPDADATEADPAPPEATPEAADDPVVDPAPDPAPDPALDMAPDPAPEPGPDVAPFVDDDQDGLDDLWESQVAEAYRPHLSLAVDDGCPLSLILFRLHPHPKGGGLVHVIYVVLYAKDCGLNGHAGDDEVHAATIDPSVPPPDGILAIRAIAHQDTGCNLVTDCGQCGMLPVCATVDRGGKPWPVVFASKGKHASYLSEAACDGACFLADQCSLNPHDPQPPMLNAGEPGHPLLGDLTDLGWITPEKGWASSDVWHYDPWAGGDFGGAGDVSLDLVDPDFDTSDPGCCAPSCPP
jgi:hypothetical protein